MDLSYQQKLEKLAKEYAHLVYRISKFFPKEEIFSLTKQLRRSSLSVLLNLVEGYARKGSKEKARFFNIAYGSLKESIITLEFAKDENFEINQDEYNTAMKLSDELGAMIWGAIQNIKTNLQ